MKNFGLAHKPDGGLPSLVCLRLFPETKAGFWFRRASNNRTPTHVLL